MLPACQVMSVADVSKPSYATPGATRLLLLKLHDGRTSCKALEHRHCSQLSDSTTPGSKVSVALIPPTCYLLHTLTAHGAAHAV